jgi:hypothetical protein
VFPGCGLFPTNWLSVNESIFDKQPITMKYTVFFLLVYLGGCLSGVAQTKTTGSTGSVGISDSQASQSATTSAASGTNFPAPAVHQDVLGGLDNNWFVLLVVSMVLLFGWGIIHSLLRLSQDRQGESGEMMRVVSMILIVTGAIVVPIIASQVSSISLVTAPLYSLLGTIAGYLFGKGSSATKTA